MRNDVAFVVGRWVLDGRSHFPGLISEVNSFLFVDCQRCVNVQWPGCASAVG